MTDDELIDEIRKRAADPKRRTDRAERWCPELASPLPRESMLEFEGLLGFALHPLHRRLFEEVGNGGFGPGDGLVGFPGGRLDDDGRSVIELREALWVDEVHPGLPVGVLPLCDWGDAVWSCVDEASGFVLTLEERGLFDTGQRLRDWLSDWIGGVDLWEKMFEFEEKSGINPITREPMLVRFPARPVGTRYSART